VRVELAASTIFPNRSDVWPRIPPTADEHPKKFLQLALHLLVLQCMELTLDEIVENEERLRREIVERECLLAAFNVLHGHFVNGQGPNSLELSSLVSALIFSRPAVARPEQRAALPPPPPPPPPPPLPKRYIHPELAAIGSLFGSGTKIVRWAIQRMTDNYSLPDIVALLEREGRPMRSAEVSVVLTRLKSRGEIEEIQRSSGPIPAVFRKPENVIAPPMEPSDTTRGMERTTASATPV
jgi:hypothetical protein